MKWPRLRSRTPDFTDEQAMRAVQQTGDPAAFAMLLDRWQPAIQRLCMRLTGDRHRGEDLAQEAFVRVFTARHQFDSTRRFSTWLWRIALNLCHEEARRATVRAEERPTSDSPLRLVRESHGREPSAEAADSERASLVRHALARLPETLRVIVVLREYEQLKFREIAEVLDLPEGTVKWRMSEALTTLSRELVPVLADDVAADQRPKERLIR